MEFLDPDEWPISAEQIAKHCEVTTTTAKRWLTGRSKAPGAARTLIGLIQRQRIMPPSWPAHWRINEADALDIGFTKIALTPQQIEWYYTSCHYWYLLVDLIPRIEARIAEIEKRARGADVIDLAQYREQLRTFKEREFLLRNEKSR